MISNIYILQDTAVSYSYCSSYSIYIATFSMAVAHDTSPSAPPTDLFSNDPNVAWSGVALRTPRYG